MRRNPAYQPDYYGGEHQDPKRDNTRDGYGSEDNLERGRRNDGYHSEPDIRKGVRGYHSDTDYRRDERSRDYHRRDDRYRYEDSRHYPDDHLYRRDYPPPRSYYDPRDNPYYYPPSRDMLHPMYIPERDPRYHQPYFPYEGDRRHNPFYMYGPMDMHNPHYRVGPDECFMRPSYYPPRTNYQHRGKRPTGKSEKRHPQVDFEDDVEEQVFDPNEVDPYLIEEIRQSKLKSRLALLVVLVLFLIASVALGTVAAALEPWWVQEKTSGTKTFDTIKVGLWRTCHRPKIETAWVCHKYSEKGFESPYQSIELLQWSMVVGTIAAFICLALALVAICGRNSRYLMGIIYTVIFFSIGATVLFGLVIAYVNEDKQARKIVGSWTTNTQADLKTSTMFAIGCAATATSGFSLILCFVLAFIYEPEIKPAEEIVENENEIKENSKTTESKTKNKEKEKKVITPKRQGTKYVKRDVDQRDSSKDVKGGSGQMNGHVKMVHNKEPAATTKVQKNPANVKVIQPNHREAPRQNGQTVMHTMQPRQNYSQKIIPKKDYGGGHPKQPHSHKPDKIPKDQNQVNVTNNKNLLPTQHNKVVNPNTVQKTKQNQKQVPMYDGEYDKYFNEPY